MTLWRLLLAIVVALPGVPAAATAERLDQTDAQRQAVALFQAAKQLFSSGEYQAAIPVFESSHLRSPHPNNLYYIAECYRRMGSRRLAHDYYLRYAQRLNGERKRDLLVKLRELRWGLVCRFELQTEPGGALVEVDGRHRGLSPLDGTALSLTLTGGMHELRVVWGSSLVTQHVSAEFGEPVRLRLKRPRDLQPPSELTTSPTPPATAAGGVEVQASVGLAVTSLGLSGQTARAGLDLEAGAGYGWRLGRFVLGAQAALTYSANSAESTGGATKFLALLAGPEARFMLRPRLWLELRLQLGVLLVLDADPASVLFAGATMVSGPFGLLAVRPAVGLGWAPWRGLTLSFVPALHWSPRHDDFAPGVKQVLQLQMPLLAGWRW